VTLFGERGACAGCWCMFFRLPRTDYERGKGTKNKNALKRIVQKGPAPGLLAYVDGRPAAWCAMAPREDYPKLAKSRVSKPVDDQPVWSVTCFFTAKEFRGQGLSVKLLKAAVQYAKKQGARIVEGYPIEPDGRYADTFAYVGLTAMFQKAGFKEVARQAPTRPIMRKSTKGG